MKTSWQPKRVRAAEKTRPASARNDAGHAETRRLLQRGGAWDAIADWLAPVAGAVGGIGRSSAGFLNDFGSGTLALASDLGEAVGTVPTRVMNVMGGYPQNYGLDYVPMRNMAAYQVARENFNDWAYPVQELPSSGQSVAGAAERGADIALIAGSMLTGGGDKRLAELLNSADDAVREAAQRQLAAYRANPKGGFVDLGASTKATKVSTKATKAEKAAKQMAAAKDNLVKNDIVAMGTNPETAREWFEGVVAPVGYRPAYPSISPNLPLASKFRAPAAPAPEKAAEAVVSRVNQLMAERYTDWVRGQDLARILADPAVRSATGATRYIPRVTDFSESVDLATRSPVLRSVMAAPELLPEAVSWGEVANIAKWAPAVGVAGLASAYGLGKHDRLNDRTRAYNEGILSSVYKDATAILSESGNSLSPSEALQVAYDRHKQEFDNPLTPVSAGFGAAAELKAATEGRRGDAADFTKAAAAWVPPGNQASLDASRPEFTLQGVRDAVNAVRGIPELTRDQNSNSQLRAERDRKVAASNAALLKYLSSADHGQLMGIVSPIDAKIRQAAFENYITGQGWSLNTVNRLRAKGPDYFYTRGIVPSEYLQDVVPGYNNDYSNITNMVPVIMYGAENGLLGGQ